MKPNHWIHDLLAILERRIYQYILCPLGIHDFGQTGMFDCFSCDKPNPPENWPK